MVANGHQQKSKADTKAPLQGCVRLTSVDTLEHFKFRRTANSNMKFSQFSTVNKAQELQEAHKLSYDLSTQSHTLATV
jgi:hypothetical protein